MEHEFLHQHPEQPHDPSAHGGVGLYYPVTIDSEEMAQWLYEYIWDVLSGYASRFDSPEPAVGVTYE